MKSLLILDDFSHFNLDSKVSDFTDFWGFTHFIIESEKHFEVSLFDVEVMLFEELNLTIGEIGEYLIFLKSGDETKFVKSFIMENLNKIIPIRPDLISWIRNEKIKMFI